MNNDTTSKKDLCHSHGGMYFRKVAGDLYNWCVNSLRNTLPESKRPDKEKPMAMFPVVCERKYTDTVIFPQQNVFFRVG